MTHDQIESTFSSHDVDPSQDITMENVRMHAKVLAHYIEDHCPDSREKSLAFTKLQECVMMANASIAIPR